VKQWKMKDLVADVSHLKNRSFSRGLEMFHVASCSKCHKINCLGTSLGPALTEVSKRFAGEKLLQQILHPSSEINKNFQTYTIIESTGKSLTGLLLREDDQAMHLLTNPLLPDEVTIVPKSEIEETLVSNQSTMPEGLLMTLSKEEILDLLAYLQAGGDPQHELFQP